MKHYKLVSEDRHSFTIHHQKDGKVFRVAKEGLNKNLQARIASLPKAMADGGVVEEGGSSRLQGDMPESPDPSIEGAGVNPDAPAEKGLVQDQQTAAPAAAAEVPKGQAIVDQFKSQLLSNEPGMYKYNPELLDRKAQDLALENQIMNKRLSDRRQEELGAKAQAKVQTDLDYNAKAAQYGLPLRGVPEQAKPAGAIQKTSYDTAGEPLNQQGASPLSRPPLSPGDSVQSIENQMLGAEGALGQAKAQDFRDQADIYKQFNAALPSIADKQDELATRNQTVSQLMQRSQKIQDDISNNKIDYNRYFNNMSSGNKILSAVSMLFGGVGQALTHTRTNMALDVIDQAVQRDVAQQVAQKNNLNTQYAQNLQLLGNAQAAKAQTIQDLRSAAMGLINQKAAENGSKGALAGAQLAQAAIKQSFIPYHAQMQMMPLKAAIEGAGGQQGGIPVAQENPVLLRQIYPDYDQRRVAAADRAFLSYTPKDAEDLKQTQALYSPIMKDINDLKAMGASAALTPEGRKNAGAILKRLGMEVNEFNGYKRFTDVDATTIEGQFNNPGALSSLFQGSGATAQTIKALQNKLESERAQRLIGYRSMDSLSSRKPGFN